MSKKISSFEKK